MADFIYKEGVIPAGGTVTVNVGGMPGPLNASLKSADGGRKIEFSTISGELWQPTYDANTASLLVTHSSGGLLAVKFTGAVGDAYNIR